MQLNLLQGLGDILGIRCRDQEAGHQLPPPNLINQLLEK